MMKNKFPLIVLMIFLATTLGTGLQAQPVQVPIKNLTRVDGVRSNQLRGFGVVVGLEGTGDDQLDFVNRSISNALSKLGISIENPGDQQIENIAAVMVTASLPPFKKPGDKIDLTVSSIGSASDLVGGVLVQTPLKAGNGEVYAVAQGSLTKGGNDEDRHRTTVRLPNGGLVEKEVPFKFVGRKDEITLQLNNEDFTTATRIASRINNRFEQVVANPENSRSVRLKVPRNFRDNPVSFISLVENLQITPAEQSKVVVNERTGTVIMGGDVAVRSISVSHGDISLQVEGEQPGVNTRESAVLPRSTSVQQIIDSLNDIGAQTDSIIAILEAMDQANALNAPLEIM